MKLEERGGDLQLSILCCLSYTNENGVGEKRQAFGGRENFHKDGP